jgi:D-3-phosphoglycerate dehydrogenase
MVFFFRGFALFSAVAIFAVVRVSGFLGTHVLQQKKHIASSITITKVTHHPIEQEKLHKRNGKTDPTFSVLEDSPDTFANNNNSLMKVISVEHGRGHWESYGNLDTYQPGKYQIKCFNKISDVGLARFDASKYDVRTEGMPSAENAHAILLRSHKLQESDVPRTCRAIARAGSGVNNINVERMTQLGIPVFNTPGANANAVKELVFCGMLLASRGIVQGIHHMRKLGIEAKKKVEKDKGAFAGREVKQKTLAVIGLGHIGAVLARDAAAGLDMRIVGYDPYLSIEHAMKLPKDIVLAESIEKAVSNADYISIHVPYMETTHGIINKDIIDLFKNDAVLLNFARGELVDSKAMREFLDRNKDARYVSDFPDDELWDHDGMMILPHLGASTVEAEDAAASMAADTLRDYLESGTIQNSVNFPDVTLPNREENTVRFTVISHDAPGVLGHIFDVFGEAKLNIVQEISKARGMVSYTVLDVDTRNHSRIEFKVVQEQITMLDGVKSSRVIYGKPGSGYAKNLGEEGYFV